MEIAFGLDNDPDAERTFEANFPNAAFIGADIANVSASAIDAVVGAWADYPLLFTACAPCQPFSRQRTCPRLVGATSLRLILEGV